jgi:hypothetical protein
MVRASTLARLLGVLILPVAALHAQTADSDDWVEYDEASPTGVALGVKAGVAFTSPRGDFPSLLIGDSQRGSGAISSAYAESGSGARYGLAALIPITTGIGVNLEFGSLIASTRFAAGPTTVATRFDQQMLVGALSLQGNLFSGDARAFRGAGLRSVYVDGGVEVGIGTVANRAESIAYADTVGEGTPAAGSFENGDPFRHPVWLRGGVGMRFALDVHFELQVEASYAYALNEVFSSEAIRGNDFTVDDISTVVGLAYRF